ncbi:MAG: hypothetical protein U1F71_20350 [Verrucomicrobiaceae bacterium]
MKPHTHDLCFRVLAYKEGGDFVAHALEADLLGYGSTIDEAMKDLIESLEAQISFAIKMGDVSLIQKEAPPEIASKWQDAYEDRMGAAFRKGAGGISRQASMTVEKRRNTADARYFGFSTDEIKSLRSNRLEKVCA